MLDHPSCIASTTTTSKIYTYNVKIWSRLDSLAQFKGSESIFNAWKLSFFCTCLNSNNTENAHFLPNGTKMSKFFMKISRVNNSSSNIEVVLSTYFSLKDKFQPWLLPKIRNELTILLSFEPKSRWLDYFSQWNLTSYTFKPSSDL